MTPARGSITLFLAIACAACAQIQAPSQPYEPKVGQAGKDVVWVPTPQPLVDTMLDLAKLAPNDYLIDLGSGDGRTVITAAKRGARAHGIEYNPDMVELSRRNAAQEGVSGRASFEQADLFKSDFSQASVITMFLLPSINVRLRPKILELKPGTRVVSNSFTMEKWNADETRSVGQGCTSWCTAYLWIVPAKVEGAWKLPQGELMLRQDFQVLSGWLRSEGSTLMLESGRVRGTDVALRVGGIDYRGRIDGERLDLATADGRRWTATRAVR